MTIRSPVKPANCPNCKTSIRFLLRSKICNPVKCRIEPFCKSIMLLSDKRNSCKFNKVRKSLLDTSVIRFRLRSRRRSAGATCSKKPLGMRVSRLACASKMCINGGTNILKIGDDAFYPSFAKRTPVLLPGRWCRVEELQVVKRQVEHHWMLQ